MAKHFPELFAGEPKLAQRALAFANKTHELISFLYDVLGIRQVTAKFEGSVTYHDSCSGLRELGIANQPRALLTSIQGLNLVEMNEHDVCCGFGGTFAVKYGEISGAIVGKKAANIAESGAAMLLAGDLGCLMNMAGRLSREGKQIEVRHIAEILAGQTNEPAIGAKPLPKD